MSHHPQVDPDWWANGRFQNRPLCDALRTHDIATLFGFLASRGWSSIAIGVATGMDPSRVREIIRGKRRVTSCQVLERIAAGLRIERGLMGLAYSHHAGIARLTTARPNR